MGFSLLVLFVGELGSYLSGEQTQDFLVDWSVEGKLRVILDMTVAMDCNNLSVDVVDAAGTSLHLQHEFLIQPSVLHLIRGPQDPHKYGTERRTDVRQIFRQAAIRRIRAVDSQPKSVMKGCRISGSIQVNKVAGNLHITALGHGYFGPHTHHDGISGGGGSGGGGDTMHVLTTFV